MSVTGNPKVNPVATYQFDYVCLYNADLPTRLFNACPSSRRREWTVNVQSIKLDGTETTGAAGNYRTYATLLATRGTPTFGRAQAISSSSATIPTTGQRIATAGEWVGSNASYGASSSSNGLAPWGQLWVGGDVNGVHPVGGTNTGVVGPTGNFAVSPDGRWIVGTTGANVLSAWPLYRVATTAVTGLRCWASKITDPTTAPTVGTISSVAFSPDGLSVVIGGGTTPFIEAYAFDPINGAWGAKASAPASLPAGPVTAVRFSPDGTMIAAGHTTSSPFLALYAWTGTAFGNRASNPGTLPLAAVQQLAWHPAGTYLTCAVNSVSTTTNVRTYPITGGATPAFGTVVTSTTTASASASAIAWAGDGNQIAVWLSGTGINYIPWTGSAFGTAYNYAGVVPALGVDRSIIYSIDGTKLYVAAGPTVIASVDTVTSTTGTDIAFIPPTVVRLAGYVQSNQQGDTTVWYSSEGPTVTFEQGANEEIWVRSLSGGSATWGGRLLCSIKEYDL